MNKDDGNKFEAKMLLLTTDAIYIKYYVYLGITSILLGLLLITFRVNYINFLILLLNIIMSHFWIL